MGREFDSRLRDGEPGIIPWLYFYEKRIFILTDSSVLYIGAKIDHTPSTVPEPSGNAAAVCSASSSPKVVGRRFYIQSRARGSSDAWVAVSGASAASTGGWLYWRGWAGQEYRSVMAGGTFNGVTYQQYISPVYTYNWTTTFLDEFDLGYLDTNKWRLRNPNSHDNSFTKNDMGAVTVNGGVAKLWLKDNPNFGQAGEPPHINGMVTTAGSPENFLLSGNYWISARVKFHPRPGAHASVWTTGGYAPGGPEVDFCEYFADDAYNAATRRVYQNVYANDDSVAEYQDTTLDTNVAGERWWDSYHTYAVRSSGNSFQFYIDGVKTGTYTSVPQDVPSEVIMSMLSSPWEQPDYQPAYASGYAMLVDYVQVVQ